MGIESYKILTKTIKYATAMDEKTQPKTNRDVLGPDQFTGINC